MALPEPPTNTPRIVEVLNPATGHYAVRVRMPTQLAAAYPTKPWGTAIDAIGLSKQDADRFLGYTLVDVEPMTGTPDLMWVFQKLSGPQWTTAAKSRDNLTPAKYRGQTDVLKTEQEVVPGTTPTTLTGNLVSSVVERQPNTGKSVLTEITEAIDVNAEPLLGKRAYVERVIADTEESLVVDGTAPESGLFVIDSQVSPLGNGKSVKDTVSYTATGDPAAWPVHVGSDWDDKIRGQLVRTEQFVAPPDANALLEPNTSFKIVNKDRSLKIVEVVPTDLLANFHRVTPVRVDLGDLPRELVSVNVIWSSQYSVGTQDQFYAAWRSGDSYSLSGGDSDQASSSASIKPDVQFRYRDLATRNLFGERHDFYLPDPVTPADIIAKLAALDPAITATMWPVFFPESFTMTATGQAINVRVNASVGLGSVIENGATVGQTSQSGTSDDFSAGITTDNIDIPPCIHGDVTVTGGTSRSQVVSATALLTISHTDVGTLTATKTKTGTAYGTVSPAVIPATGGVAQNIPTSGIYILDFDTAQYKWNHSLVSVVLFDASALDPAPPP